jgi:hypothetical protein
LILLVSACAGPMTEAGSSGLSGMWSGSSIRVLTTRPRRRLT